MDLINQLNWRYATKKFDQTKKLTTEQLDIILNAINLSASSFGVQPYRILVIEDKNIRTKLRQDAFDQPQVTDASHLLIFAVQNQLTDYDIDIYIESIAKARQQSTESLRAYSEMIKNSLGKLNEKQRTLWASKQAYIALGQLLTSCAILQIDACPMGGFDRTAFDKILHLKEKNLSSEVIAAVGFRSATDKYQYLQKVRKPLNEMIIKL